MKSTELIDFKDSELPVYMRAPIFHIVVAILFMLLPAIGCIYIGILIFFGNDPHNILWPLFMGSVGLGLLLGSAFTISTQIELTPTTIEYKNIFRRKSLQINQIVSANKWQTKNGPMLKIKTKDDYLLLGYLTFSTVQIGKIEGFIHNRMRIKI